jgi:flagellar biosynthetic protein FliR
MSTALLVTMGLVAARMGGVVMIMPTFGARGVPKMARVLVVLSMTVVIAPNVPQATTPLTVAGLLFGMAIEVIVGVLIGGVVAFVFGALSLANEILSNQIGHGAAQLFDPMLKVSHGPLAALATLLAAAIFVGTNLHLVLLVNVADSLHAVPPGSVLSPIGGGAVWIQVGEEVFRAGLTLAGPVLALVFLIHCFVAVLTRLAPQMNIFFSLGMVMTVIAGCWLLAIMLPYQLEAHFGMVSHAVGRVPEVLQQMDIAR